MKKIIFLILIAFLTITVVAQPSLEKAKHTKDYSGEIAYLVGSPQLGYPSLVQFIPYGYVNMEDTYPILRYYKMIENEFAGGWLINEEKNDTSIIKDFELIIIENSVGLFCISVVGDNFGFVLNTNVGAILKSEDSFVLFARNKNRGEIFRIVKKQH